MLGRIMTHKEVQWLLLISFIVMLGVYTTVLGVPKTINIIVDGYWFILAFVVLLPIYFFYKGKTKGLFIIDFNARNNLSLKSTILFFLFFQVIDYISEDGFIGMISQWFTYWIMGMIMVLVLGILNFYRNLKISR